MTATTPEQDRFMAELLALEPGTQNGGMYAYKAGYHNTRGNLQAEPEWRNDYSIRDAVDKRGPSDKCAAYDWTFPEAQRGDYSRISVYGGRLRRAWETRDPLLAGWREALIQADMDSTPEGFDFRYHTLRTPSSDHSWHGHLSENRELVGSWDNKAKMLTVLRGGGNGGSAPGPIGDEMTPEEHELLVNIRRELSAFASGSGSWTTAGGSNVTIIVPASRAEVAAIGNVVLTDEQVQAIADQILAALPEGFSPTAKQQLRQAVADVLLGGAANVG